MDFDIFCRFCQKISFTSNCCYKPIVDTSRFEFKVYSPFIYEYPVIPMILGFKYNYKFDHGYFFAKSIMPLLPKNPVLIPVPLSDKKLFHRGYNQSFVLCRYLSNLISARIENCFIRHHSQLENITHKNLEGRIASCNNIQLQYIPQFAAHETPVIIDDVIVAGSTIRRMMYLLERPISAAVVAVSI